MKVYVKKEETNFGMKVTKRNVFMQVLLNARSFYRKHRIDCLACILFTFVMFGFYFLMRIIEVLENEF